MNLIKTSLLAVAIVFTFGHLGCQTNPNVSAEEQADATTATVVAASFEATAAALAFGPTLVVNGVQFQIVNVMKNAIEFTPTASCPGGSVPNPTGGEDTIFGLEQGGCAIDFDNTAMGLDNDLSIKMECTGYDDDLGAILDGTIGYEAEVDGTNADGNFDYTSGSLSTRVDGNLCDMVLNFGISTITLGNILTITANGCVVSCGQAFTVSGTEQIDLSI